VVDWGAGGLVVELDPLELMVLRHAGGASEAVEDALAELRRRHHDGSFWAAAPADPFPALPQALEALRRFQLEAGFYTTTHAPLESLRQWAQPALQALLQAQVWSADAATQGLWLPWGLEGASSLREPPSAAGLLAFLGGEEVVVVGEGTEALQAAHRAGRLFEGGVFGLRCLAVPQSRHPHRPAAGFEHSLEALVAAVEQLYRERPFTVLLADGGAYRLPLVQAINSRFGVLAVAGATGLAGWLGGQPVQELH
jgi:phosphoglycolate phosphatase-like HAD superfamily hydrolase